MLKDIQIEADIKALARIQADDFFTKEMKYKMYKNIAQEIINNITEVTNANTKVDSKPIEN